MAMVVLGSVPAGVAGVALKLTGVNTELFNNPAAVGLCFWITATVLRFTSKPSLCAKCEPVELKKITVKQTLIIGFAQMLAILPGISRSGSTIATGVLCGVKREDAATFSFLLATPAICGAMLLEILDFYKDGIQVEGSPLVLIAAVIISAITSYGALKLLVNIVKRGKLVWFSWYLYAAGAVTLLVSLRGLIR
jgi:undecaprenyl-diphosphatase